MNLTPKERAERKASFRKMNLPAKVDYLWTYYKLPISLTVLALALVFSGLYHHFTKKEVLLYAGYANISVGQELDTRLTTDFVSDTGANPRRAEVYVYRALYLDDNATTENHQYAYASKLKVMASIASKQLDVVLMNKDAYDNLSGQDYLMPLPDLLAQNGELASRLADVLVDNTVILEDNSEEVALNEAEEYEAVTREDTNGIDVSGFPLFRQAGFSGSVYIGVVANTTHPDAVLSYLEWVTRT